MKITLSEIAALSGGVVRGDGNFVVEGAAGLDEATEKDISFLSNAKYASRLKATRAGALLLPPETETDRPAVLLKNPSYGWAKVLEVLEKERRRPPAGGVHATALVAPTAQLGAGVTIGPYVVIEDGAVVGDNTVIQAHGFIGADTTIGRDCLFHPRVTVRERVTIGDRCIFHPGVVIGGDGFGFTVHEGRHYKIPQVGAVEIGDDVEIQANSTVDRAAAGATRIGRGTKVDNLVQIAHNVEIGEHCIIVALTGIAGSAKLGRYVTLGAQVGIAGHLTVGDFVQVGARGGISHDIKPKEIVWGSPAQPLKEELKTLALIRRLPELFEEVKYLKKRMNG